MAVTFSRTLRSLRADGFRLAVAAICGVMLLLAVWAAWYLLARVSVYEVTPQARVEVVGSAHVVESPVLGRVLSVGIQLGREVAAGEALVALETVAEASTIDEEEARIEGLVRRLEGLRAARQAHREAAASSDASDQAAVTEAGAGERRAAVALQLSEAELTRAEGLGAEGVLSTADLEEARSEVEQRRAELEQAASELARARWQRRDNAGQRRALVADYDEDIAEVEGQLATAPATVRRLRHGLFERVIRSPVGGRLEQVAVLTPGSVVDEGDPIAVVVPRDELQIVALFPAASALGRVQPGQRAWVYLHAYPWLQYGKVPAEVVRVGSEPAAGLVRVELAPRVGPGATIPLRHGLEGAVSVEVERVSPAELVLRAVGRRVLGTGMQAPAGTG